MEDREEKKEQDKPTIVISLGDDKVEKEELTKCCGSSDCSKKCCDDCRKFFGLLFSRIRSFSLGCSSLSCVVVSKEKTVKETLESKQSNSE